MTKTEAIELLNNLIGMVEDNRESDYDNALKIGIEALRTDGDTISRRAAIDALGEAHFKNWGNAAMVIKYLPSAQPEDYNFKPGDGNLISRRSLLRNIIKRLGIKNQDYFTAQESVVIDCIYEEMPVPLPELREGGEVIDDLISRKAVIDEISRFIGYLDEDMILRIQTGIKKLPSTQPMQNQRIQDVGGVGEIINRHAAIEHIKNRLYETALNNMDGKEDIYLDIADNRIETWLSEVPAIREWIRTSEKPVPRGMEVLVTVGHHVECDFIENEDTYFYNTGYPVKAADAWMLKPDPYKEE